MDVGAWGDRNDDDGVAEQLPTEKELEESLKILTSPQPLKQGWSAEDVVNDETAQAATQSLATLRKEQAAYAKVMQLMDGGIDIIFRWLRKQQPLRACR